MHVPLKLSSEGERFLRLRLNSGKGFDANGKMLIDVLAQHQRMRTPTTHTLCICKS
jgi:hypothetical protein